MRKRKKQTRIRKNIRITVEEKKNGVKTIKQALARGKKKDPPKMM